MDSAEQVGAIERNAVLDGDGDVVAVGVARVLLADAGSERAVQRRPVRCTRAQGRLVPDVPTMSPNPTDPGVTL